MMTDIITLIGQTRGVDEYGDPVLAESSRTVFCEVASVGQKEFYQAHAVGLQPELKFILADYLDYEGERYAVYAGTRYSVLRTYRKGLQLELTCTRQLNPTKAPLLLQPEPEADD